MQLEDLEQEKTEWMLKLKSANQQVELQKYSCLIFKISFEFLEIYFWKK